MTVAQQTCPDGHMDAFIQVTPPIASAPPELLPLLPPLLEAPVSSIDASVAGGGVVGLLLDPQATASETAAPLDTAHKIIEFFILKTSLLSLCVPQAARVLDRAAVSYPSPLSERHRKYETSGGEGGRESGPDSHLEQPTASWNGRQRRLLLEFAGANSLGVRIREANPRGARHP
jgi:hypothetical protein